MKKKILYTLLILIITIIISEKILTLITVKIIKNSIPGKINIHKINGSLIKNIKLKNIYYKYNNYDFFIKKISFNIKIKSFNKINIKHLKIHGISYKINDQQNEIIFSNIKCNVKIKKKY